MHKFSKNCTNQRNKIIYPNTLLIRRLRHPKKKKKFHRIQLNTFDQINSQTFQIACLLFQSPSSIDHSIVKRARRSSRRWIIAGGGGGGGGGSKGIGFVKKKNPEIESKGTKGRVFLFDSPPFFVSDARNIENTSKKT